MTAARIWLSVHAVHHQPLTGWWATESMAWILRISLFRPPRVRPWLRNIFSSFFVPLRLFCLGNLMTCLSSTLKIVTVVIVNNDVGFTHGKICTAVGIMDYFYCLFMHFFEQKPVGNYFFVSAQLMKIQGKITGPFLSVNMFLGCLWLLCCRCTIHSCSHRMLQHICHVLNLNWSL